MAVELLLSLLALSALTAASPEPLTVTSPEPNCEELVKPLELQDRSPIYGKWIFHAGTSDSEYFLMGLKAVQNSWIHLAAIDDSDAVNLRWGDKVDGKCILYEVNSTIAGNSTKVTFNFNASSTDHVGKYLETCPDCILWTDKSEMVTNGVTHKGRNFFFFTRTGKVEASQLEVFKKQAACLNFPSDFHFGDDTDLCPEEKEAVSTLNEE